MAIKKMNPKVKKAWVKALESGEFEQGRGKLIKNFNNRPELCCLGVLCEIEGSPNGASYRNYPPVAVNTWAGLEKEYNDKFAELNDSRKWSFKRIAAYIKRYY